MAVALGHGLPNMSEKYYDASGSLTHLSVIVSSLLSARERDVRQIVASVMGVMWLTRLGSFLFLRILCDGRDSRFDRLKKGYLSFLSPWIIQACWVFITDLPIVIVNTQPAGSDVLTQYEWAGFGLWAVGFFFELIADTQKRMFRSDPANKGRFITTGLWAYCQQPNYFGEILMWVAICIATQGAQTAPIQRLAWLSPAFTWLLLTKVSGVPLLRKKADKKWGDDPEYQAYVKNVNVIVPGFSPFRFSSD